MERLDTATLATACAPLAWKLEGRELVKVVRLQDFRDALRYVNEVGALAEAAGHHPDVEIRWNSVTLRLSTHSLGGITDADIALAERIDGLR